MPIGKKSSKVFITIIATVVILAGAGYYFMEQAQQKAVAGLTHALQKGQIQYHDINCRGILSMTCHVNHVSLGDGTKIEQIIFKNFEQFATVAEEKSASINLNIELKGIDSDTTNFQNKMMLFTMMTGKHLSQTDAMHIEKIARLLVQGDMFIKGHLEFENKKLHRFDDFGFVYDNNLFPFDLIVSGSDKLGAKQDPRNVSFTKIQFGMDLQHKKETFAKIYKILSSNPKLTDAMIENQWHKFVTRILMNIQKKKATLSDPLALDLLNTVENVLKDNKRRITMIVRSKNATGISAMDIINNSRNKKFLLDHVDLKVTN
ncbi:hypothetical protein [Sulfurospirillum sp. 1612]|uniref:hypothetical protein n=1 Tax=Sulfurospirillum sp. 1612 TaxID=3094835 RepID=UPI002F94FEB3